VTVRADDRQPTYDGVELTCEPSLGRVRWEEPVVAPHLCHVVTGSSLRFRVLRKTSNWFLDRPRRRVNDPTLHNLEETLVACVIAGHKATGSRMSGPELTPDAYDGVRNRFLRTRILR